ncbi:Carboxypeptidase regulatory-like domain-containing protein [Desulfonema limicola]|uniref:Carboxypeptidase regulatory-like domain-containing protein n=1 Tax=Desulfonema limicola TaxID=45656 RepID=A0A975BAM6_9BACT|nr:carboxypeptidase-like regulatory domain-containing protein [Desulfonema limicola]QTA81797.1 Carboxypeptidase regulatory-like domain-containing protein [Desulfonema limicola]
MEIKISKPIIYTLFLVIITTCGIYNNTFAQGFIETPTIVFQDNFDDSVIDLSKWRLGTMKYGDRFNEVGATTTESNGILRVSQDITDAGGYVRSQPIQVNPTGNIIIKKRFRVHYANQYFTGASSLYDVDNNETVLGGIGYTNYHYKITAVGFSLHGSGGSVLLDPIWDEWIEDQLVYNPETGEAIYTLNNEYSITNTLDILTGTQIAIDFYSYGWWTGHYMEVDWITVEQAQKPDSAIYKIEGYTFDADGYPIANVTIQLNGETFIYSDVNGYYLIEGLAEGDYVVSAEMDGIDFESNSVQVLLNNDSPFTRLDFKELITSQLIGDIDKDGDVDRDDAKIVQTYINKPVSECPECDLDGDSTITILDARKIVQLCTCIKCLCP